MLKNPELLVVGVDEEASSLSDMQSGFELPLRLGPGLAMEEYPDELKFDSDVVRLPQLVVMIYGLK